MTRPATHAHTARVLHGSGEMCADARAGHDLHPLQRRLAAATPSRWIDAIAGETDQDGWLELHAIDGGSVTRVWHHQHLGAHVAPGEPVALHAGYRVLATGARWLNVDAG